MPRATQTRPVSCETSSTALSFPVPAEAPQPAFLQLSQMGYITGDVLDVGCGSGENALMLAEQGHMTWGIDLSRTAIESARAKAEQRGLNATFVLGNALELDILGEAFHTILDSGLFVSLNEAERKKYLQHLGHVMLPGGRFYLLCPACEIAGESHAVLSRRELKAYFQKGWHVQDIRDTVYQVGSQQVKAWLFTLEKA
jgi:ubiquinone/menaquinone biosynthesis C-methylase UbiE